MFDLFNSSDPNLTLQIASQIAEVGSFFHLTVKRSPTDGADNPEGSGHVREVRVYLEFETEGRGDTDTFRYDSTIIPIDRFGMGSADIKVAVPERGPVSYRGALIALNYQIVIATDVQRGIDPKTNIPVIVVPKNGANTYQQAHPLPSSFT